MNKEACDKVPYHFHGLTVLVPKQRENELVVMDLGSFLPKNLQTRTENFTLIRIIANMAVFNKADFENRKMEPVKTFDPPIEIRVAYNFYDVMESNSDIRQLKLAFWDGSQWVILSDPAHEYQILPPSTAQVAEAKIWSWTGDPPLAWGR